jgi:hypothetical protein
MQERDLRPKMHIPAGWQLLAEYSACFLLFRRSQIPKALLYLISQILKNKVQKVL